MLRTGTGLAIPQELLHSGEVARGPQPLAADGTRERLERDLGTPPVVHVARDAGQPQQHPSRPRAYTRRSRVSSAARARPTAPESPTATAASRIDPITYASRSAKTVRSAVRPTSLVSRWATSRASSR